VFSSSLETFDIEMNRIEGEIPDEVFSSSTRLKEFNVGKNQMDGTISADFGELSDLEILILSQNQFRGTVPSTLGKLSNLVVLDIGYNNVEGSMPRDVCQLLDVSLVYLASDCAVNGGSSEFECECCTACYPIFG